MIPPHATAGSSFLQDRINTARMLCPLGVTLQCAEAAALDFPNDTFDIVLQSTVFTSILDLTMKQQIAHQMIRVLKPEGMILWYDYFIDNPRNPNVRAVKQREIRRLFPGTAIDLHRVTLAPPITRLVAPRSWLVCHLLELFPWMRTHYLGVIRKTIS